MEANQDVPRPFTLLMQAIAYVLGGMFLFDAGIRFLVGAGARTVEVFGVVFIAFGFFLVISSFFNRLTSWANTINFELFLGLFIVTLADLFVVAVESTQYLGFHLIVAVAFSVIVIAAMLFEFIRRRRGLR
jgi:hypothetical protein